MDYNDYYVICRHHVYHHQGVDGATYRVLDTLYPDQAKYSLHNSSLSEFG